MRYSCKGDSSQRQLNLSAAASPDVLRSAAEAGAEIVRTAVQGRFLRKRRTRQASCFRLLPTAHGAMKHHPVQCLVGQRLP